MFMRHNIGGATAVLSIGRTEGLFALILICVLSIHAFAADLGLIDADDLNLNISRWVVLDGRPKTEWEKGRIPGARSFSWEDYTRTDEKGAQYSIFPAEELAHALAGLGIDEKTPVAVYGDADKSWGGEGWDVWVLSRLGHQGPIRLLNGGIRAWRGRNLPLTKGPEKPRVKKDGYHVDLKPGIEISTEDLESQKERFVVVDVRSTLEWLRGRIPGAIHLPWERFYSGANRYPLGPAELKKLLADHGVDLQRPVVYYCLGGVRSGYAWTVHELAGLPDARNYTGGMAAWQKRKP